MPTIGMSHICLISQLLVDLRNPRFQNSVFTVSLTHVILQFVDDQSGCEIGVGNACRIGKCVRTDPSHRCFRILETFSQFI